MVDITRCEVCGRVIPATEYGCAYCEREREGEQERPYLPLAVRLLLGLFVANVLVAGGLAVVTLVHSGGSGVVVVLAVVRLGSSVITVFALTRRRPWGRFVPLGFLAVEILGGLAADFHWVDGSAWRADMLAPLWNALFLFLFLRPDVQGRFDHKVLDRHEVGSLIRLVQRGGRER
jgi:hypothetical protein